ncbi:AAA family ATPase [Thioclava sp. GXIMD2076]|uniref:AAA family ATPase n=1 Tax=Thioclava sp. GXIMD2076 TaxID=3131931 RepID=UPI0030D432C3
MDEYADGYRVLFVNEKNLSSTTEPGTILIAPSLDSWNDFGERILIEAVLQPRLDAKFGSERLEFRGFFGFLDKQGDNYDTLPLRDLIDRASAPTSAEKVPAYFTMLPDMESYRRIVGQLGPEEARIALRAMNDIVEADDRPAGRQWLNRARNSPLFLNAFLRNSESYFTWKNAAPILRGVEFEELGRISSGLHIQFQLAGRPNAHDLKFRFAQGEHVLPQRFAVVIGKNGVGKSQALAQIIDAALLGKSELTDLDGHRPIFNRILGFYPSASASSAYPSDRRKRSRFWYRRFPLMSRWSKHTASDLIIQLARSIEGIAGQSRYKIFLNAVTAIEGHKELVLRTKDGEDRPVSIFELNQGGEQKRLERYAAINVGVEPVRMIEGKTYRLSSGELSFLRFAALTSLFIENGTLLLFDEPETHLHPNFISQFVALLDKLLEQTGSVAILATHSVYFVRETMEDQVTVLRSDADRRVLAETPTLKTFGADVGAISYFVFGEDQPSRLAQEVETKIMAHSVSWEQIFETYKDRVSLDLLGEIRARVERSEREAGGQ